MVFSFVVGQETQLPESENENIQASEQESDFVIATTSGADAQVAENAETTGAGGTLWLFARMILALIFVIALVYGIVFFLKKGLVSKEAENPFLKRAATLSLAPGKTVHVVTLPGKAWLVGVSDSAINLIGEITDEDLVNQMILEAEKAPTSKPRDFASILNTFSSTFSSSVKQTENTLKLQRERLRRGDHNE